MTASSPNGDNPITRMFDWWNQAYRDDSFTPEAFARFFTEDAPFVVDGGVRGTGPGEICAHFQRIRANTQAVELTMPVQATMADGELGFVRYGATARRSDGLDQSEQCLAMARLRDGRIAAFEVFGRAT